MKKKAKRFIRTCLSRNQDLASGLQPFSSSFFCYGDVVEVEVPRWAKRGKASFIYRRRVTAGGA